MGIASLVLGIIALLFSFIPLIGGFAIVPACVGVLLGALQIFWRKKRGGVVVTGLILSLLGGFTGWKNFALTSEAVEGLDESMNGRVTKELALIQAYAIDKEKPEGPEMFIAIVENTSSKPIQAFRGDVVRLDGFNEESHRNPVACTTVLQPGKRIVLGQYTPEMEFEPRLFAADSIDVLMQNMLGPAEAETIRVMLPALQVRSKMEFRCQKMIK